MKVVINTCFGGFGVSKEAVEWMKQDTRYSYDHPYDIGRDRSDPLLVECVEKLGKKANGTSAELKIVEIPDGVSYEIMDYDGKEHIAESHRTWG